MKNKGKNFAREINYLEGNNIKENIEEIDSDQSDKGSERYNTGNISLNKDTTDLANKSSPFSIRKSPYKLLKNLSQGEIDFITSVEFEAKRLDKYFDKRFDALMSSVIDDIIKGKSIVLDKEIFSFKETVNKVFLFDAIKNSFEIIEKEIIYLRLNQVVKNINEVIILCSVCFEKAATVKCFDCENERFCNDCKSSHISNKFFEKHKLIKLPQNRDIRGFIPPEKSYIIDEIRDYESNDLKAVKMGFYSFPLSYNSLAYEGLKDIFSYLYLRYIDDNGIGADNTITLSKSLNKKIQQFEMSKVNPIVWMNQKLINKLVNSKFNTDELFLINRVCFLLFKKLGSKTTLEIAYEYLKKFEEGQYEEKLKILLSIMDIYDNKVLFKSEFIKVMCGMGLQPYSEIKSILYSLFKENNSSISYDAAYESLLKDEQFSKALRILLQIDN